MLRALPFLAVSSLLGAVLLFASACGRAKPQLASSTASVTSAFAGPDAWTLSEVALPAPNCKDSEFYIPDTAHLGFWPIKHVRINYHAFDKTTEPNPVDTVWADTGFQILTLFANDWLANPRKPILPKDNPPALVPTRFRYQLTGNGEPGDLGVYYHFDDEIPYHVHLGRERNIGNGMAFKRYGTDTDSILNVMALRHHPDSIKYGKKKPGTAGVALGNRYIKLVHHWHTKEDEWKQGANLIHEISHVYSLNHTWKFNDGCDDTPMHDNCWNYNQPAGCNEVSNNIMDYTAMAEAFTPCQIGRIHYQMARENTRQRKFLEPNWCEGLPNQDVTVTDTFTVRHAADLEGNLILKPGAQLTVRCRLSIPAGKKIVVHPGAELRLFDGKLHNSCGLAWEGIELLSRGKQQGRLVYTAKAAIEDVAAGRGLPPLSNE